MAKHTQAHLPRRFNKMGSGMTEMTQRQMEYYMGAKLLELGVDPKTAIYRWTTEDQGNDELWTYSAYWGESKTELLHKEQGTNPT